MNYPEALKYLQELTDLEHIAHVADAPRFDLRRVAELLARLGHPERQLRAIHVVGTKGKGSTAVMVASILQAAGYRVGLYSSPHLHTFRERMRIDGLPINPQAMADATERVRPAVVAVHSEYRQLGRLTTFEVATAVALVSFARHSVDFAVLEAGLGGRLDATNVVRPVVTVLTPIGLDHTAYLGNTVEAIAREKAAVIKPGVPVVSAQQRSEAEAVIVATAKESRAALAMIGREWQWQDESRGTIAVARRGGEIEGLAYAGIAVPLLGRHQRENAALAVAAVDALDDPKITETAVVSGIAAVRWPGRLEIMRDRPMLVVDGAHNPDAMRRLREALGEVFGQRRFLLVLGTSADKDIDGIMAEILPTASSAIFTESSHPRAARLSALIEAAKRYRVPAEAVNGVAEALRRAIDTAAADDVICVTGSLFVVAEAREALLGQAVQKDLL